jgi:replicative DNA helicase
MEHSSAYVRRVFRQLDERFKSDGNTGIRTGIPSLDRAGGLLSGDLVVLAGRPAVGKTALALHIATQACCHGTPSLYFSLAESGEQITERALTAGAEVDSTRLRRGRATRADMSALTGNAAMLSRLPLHIRDAVDLTACQLRALVAEWRTSNHDSARALVVVDCVQLLCGDGEGCGTRDEEIGAAIRTMQNAAKESRVSIVLVSHLSGGQAARPQLCELRESAALEAAAAVVLLAHAPGQQGSFEVIVAKHRRCAVPVTDEFDFDGATGTYRALAPEDEIDTPLSDAQH